MSLKIAPNPVFTAPVHVPVPGAEAAEITLRFRHKSRTELADFMVRANQATTAANDLDLLMEIVDGWEGAAVVDDAGAAMPFSREALGRVVEQYFGAPQAIVRSYSLAYVEARRKN